MQLNLDMQQYALDVLGQTIYIPVQLVTDYENSCAPFDERCAEYLIVSDGDYNEDQPFSSEQLAQMLINGMKLEMKVYGRRADIIAQAEKKGLFA